jgi:hypothetical protein
VAERRERHRLETIVGKQCPERRSKRRNCSARTARTQHEQRDVGRPGGGEQVVEERQRLAVGPLDIVDHDGSWPELDQATKSRLEDSHRVDAAASTALAEDQPVEPLPVLGHPRELAQQNGGRAERDLPRRLVAVQPDTGQIEARNRFLEQACLAETRICNDDSGRRRSGGRQRSHPQKSLKLSKAPNEGPLRNVAKQTPEPRPRCLAAPALAANDSSLTHRIGRRITAVGAGVRDLW